MSHRLSASQLGLTDGEPGVEIEGEEMSESSAAISLENRILNSIRRNFTWLSQDAILPFLSVIGPVAFLDMRNIGWKAMEHVQVMLNSTPGLKCNPDFAVALPRHYRGDAFQLSDGSWV